MRSPIVDLHQDISYYYVTNPTASKFPREEFSKDIPGRHGDIPKFKRADVGIVFSSIFCLLNTLSPAVSSRLGAGYDRANGEAAYTTKGAPTNAIEHMKVYYSIAEQFADSIHMILEMGDLDRAINLESIGFLVALEGAYALEDVGDLDVFYHLGLRSLQLSWNFDSRYNASCMSTKDYGLTGEGEELIERCNELGVIIDLAHASPRTQFEVAGRSKLPVINSHSNAKAVRDMSRNLDDETYEAIRRNGGVVGSIVDVTMAGKKNDVASLADHVMYVHDKFGADILAIGTDFFGLLDPVSGIEDITKLEALFGELRRRGMTEEALKGMAYQNALRVMTENAKKWRR